VDRFVKNFIIASILYLVISSLFGVLMMANHELLTLKFVHSHFMLLGWVSMMIYGVGYHILPRFSGKLLKNKALAEAQFWMANIGLLGMVTFYTLEIYKPETGIYQTLAVISGFLEVASIVLFFYNMIKTLFTNQEG
jgi:cytochrome c oxidase cbb3-type subunit 1